MKIEQLLYDEYQGKKIQVSYLTKGYQDIKIKKKNKNIQITLKRKKMKKTTKNYEIEMFADYILQPIGFGMFDRKKLIGFIIGEYTDWNQTFKIWEIYVEPKYRKKGIGYKLFKHMERHILTTKARAIILEVASCNDPAIKFYENVGMHFIGLDTLFYSNYDVQNKEVKLTYGKRMI